MGHRHTLITMLTVLFSSACAFTPQAVTVQPRLDGLSASDAGHERSIVVTVSDQRAHAPAIAGSPWTTSGEMEVAVRNTLEEGLRQLGFTIAAAPGDGSAELRVEIRSLGYRIQSGFWTSTLQSECATEGACMAGGQKSYQQLYRSTYDEAIWGIPTHSLNERSASQALSQSLRSLITDPSLISCLVEAQ